MFLKVLLWKVAFQYNQAFWFVVFLLCGSPVPCYAQWLQSCSRLFATLWTVAHQTSLSVKFFQKDYWSGFPCPTPGDLPDPGIEPISLASPALAGGFFIAEPPGNP